LWGRPPFNEFILPPVIPAVLPSGIGWRTAVPAPSLIERKPGIYGTFAALSAHRGHALLVGSERAIAAEAIRYGAGAPWIVAGHGWASGGHDEQSGKCEE
jgi:hypothetical protein